MTAKVVSPEEWIAARKDLLLKEKELTRATDALSAQLRELPMVKVTKQYTFEGPDGKASLSLLDLFNGRKQLIIYHFMLGPDMEQGCSGCSFFADHVPDLSHLQSRNTSFVAVSRAPIAKIEAFKKRMGWTFPWYSSFGTDFNYDFHATQDESIAPIEYNFKDKATLEKDGQNIFTKGEQPGLSVFYLENSVIFHTYSAYSRGLEKLLGTHSLLDMTPLGRQEGGTVSGIKRFTWHDKYDEDN
jgi:predicted dithiol-disulfide oxidoreductase (DUF899 family)